MRHIKKLWPVTILGVSLLSGCASVQDNFVDNVRGTKTYQTKWLQASKNNQNKSYDVKFQWVKEESLETGLADFRVNMQLHTSKSGVNDQSSFVGITQGSDCILLLDGVHKIVMEAMHDSQQSTSTVEGSTQMTYYNGGLGSLLMPTFKGPSTYILKEEVSYHTKDPKALEALFYAETIEYSFEAGKEKIAGALTRKSMSSLKAFYKKHFEHPLPPTTSKVG